MEEAAREEAIEETEVKLDLTRQCLFVVLLSAFTGPLIYAQSASFDPADELQTSNLKGLNAVGVVVSELNADLESIGLTQDQIKADTEGRLKQSGIRILNGRDRLNTAGQPYLYVVIDTSCSNATNVCALYVTVRVVERTRLERDSTLRTYSSTWSHGTPLMTVGKNQLDTVRDLVNELVEQFKKALQTANA